MDKRDVFAQSYSQLANEYRELMRIERFICIKPAEVKAKMQDELNQTREKMELYRKEFGRIDAGIRQQTFEKFKRIADNNPDNLELFKKIYDAYNISISERYNEIKFGAYSIADKHSNLEDLELSCNKLEEIFQVEMELTRTIKEEKANVEKNMNSTKKGK